jgi:hypothetical protein
MLKIGSSVVVALSIAAAAYAHHSAAGIDQTKTVTQEGVVKEFKWANPHSWLEIEVQNSKGATEIWNLEMNPPSYLVRAGWKSTTVKPGDKIKFSARPFKNGDPGGLFVSVTLPSGQTLGQQPARGAQGAPAAPIYEQK